MYNEEANRNKVQGMWKNILEMLPHQPRSFDTSEDTGVKSCVDQNLKEKLLQTF